MNFLYLKKKYVFHYSVKWTLKLGFCCISLYNIAFLCGKPRVHWNSTLLFWYYLTCKNNILEPPERYVFCCGEKFKVFYWVALENRWGNVEFCKFVLKFGTRLIPRKPRKLRNREMFPFTSKRNICISL